jgi:hypothetical protein
MRAWWLATGWNSDQRKILIAKFGAEDPKQTETFKQELKLVDENLDQASNSAVRAKALNDKAWRLATYGVDLDQAESAVREALKCMLKVNQKAARGTWETHRIHLATSSCKSDASQRRRSCFLKR